MAISSSNSPEKPVYPCGTCSQIMAEFNLKITIFVDGDENSHKLFDLLPKSFNENQMK